MYIDRNKEIIRVRVAGAIASEGCVRTVLAGTDVRVSTYMDRKGYLWTVATYDINPELDGRELEIQGYRVRKALRQYSLRWIRRF